MRQHTAGDLTLARGVAPKHHGRFEVLNTDGIWVDLTSWLIRADWGREGPDPATMDGSAEFLREVDPSLSLAPYIGASTLNRNAADAYVPLLKSGRRMRIRWAITPAGVAPSTWRLGIEGVLDEVDSASGDNVSVNFRDLGAVLLDRHVEALQTYSAGGGTSMEDVLEAMLFQNGHGSVALHVPQSPGWAMDPLDIEDGPLLDNMRKVANSIGWDVRYEFDPADDGFKLTLFQPHRDLVIPQATLGPGDYEEVAQFNETETETRNVVQVDFTHLPTERRDTVIVSDAASIARLAAVGMGDGRRFMRFPVEATFNIHTVADATALAQTVLADLKDNLVDSEKRLWFLPWVQVGDLYAFLPNDVHYDSTQSLYVSGFRHEMMEGHIYTNLRVRGTPIGLYRTWHRRADLPTLAPEYQPVLKVRVLSSNRTQQVVEITATNPTGGDVFLEWRVGSGGWSSKQGASPQSQQVTLDRTVQGEDRVLYARAVALDSELEHETQYTADWDFLPEVVDHKERPLIDANGQQVGWRIEAVVDDDTNSLVVDKESGTFVITGSSLIDTSVVKTVLADVLQDVGQQGVLRLRPFALVGGLGLEGKTTPIDLLRVPVSTHDVEALNVTQSAVRLSANPEAALVHWRQYLEGAAPPTPATWVDGVAQPVPRIVVSLDPVVRTVIEHFARVPGVAPGPTQRLVLDAGTSADIEIVNAEYNGNVVTVTLNLEDDDIHRWELYAAPGSGFWPTEDGLEDGVLDNAMLRDEAFGLRQPRSMYLPDGIWNFIAVAYDRSNTPGPRDMFTLNIDNSTPPPPRGTIKGAYVMPHPFGAPTTHLVGWFVDANVTLDYYVKVYWRRRNVTDYVQVGGNIPAVDDSYVVAPSPFTSYGEGGGATWETYDYKVELYDLAGLVNVKTASHSGYYTP